MAALGCAGGLREDHRMNGMEVQVRSTIERLLRFLEKCVTNGFFGRVTVSFQNGRVCDVKVEQNRKLDEL